MLTLLTVINAMVGLRQAGKAESALKSLTKRTGRVRRHGVEASIPAEQVVVGDLVLLAGAQIWVDDDPRAAERELQAAAAQAGELGLGLPELNASGSSRRSRCPVWQESPRSPPGGPGTADRRTTRLDL